MTTSDLAPRTTKAAQVERVVIENDLSKLSPEERLQYYIQTCDALGLTWQTKPFSYLQLNGKLTLYATRDCTDQLRKIHGVSIDHLERERMDDIYVVTATARTADGRTDSSVGAVPISNLKGEQLANALMKCETKAKRRVTLSICGLGMTDETEVASIPGATIVEPDALPAQTHTAPRETAPGPEVAPTLPSEPAAATPYERAKDAWTKLQVRGAEVDYAVPDMHKNWGAATIRTEYDTHKAMVEAAEELAS